MASPHADAFDFGADHAASSPLELVAALSAVEEGCASGPERCAALREFAASPSGRWRHSTVAAAATSALLRLEAPSHVAPAKAAAASAEPLCSESFGKGLDDSAVLRRFNDSLAELSPAAANAANHPRLVAPAATGEAAAAAARTAAIEALASESVADAASRDTDSAVSDGGSVPAAVVAALKHRTVRCYEDASRDAHRAAAAAAAAAAAVLSGCGSGGGGPKGETVGACGTSLNGCPRFDHQGRSSIEGAMAALRDARAVVDRVQSKLRAAQSRRLGGPVMVAAPRAAMSPRPPAQEVLRIMVATSPPPPPGSSTGRSAVCRSCGGEVTAHQARFCCWCGVRTSRCDL